MATTSTALMTVDEFYELPDTDPFYYELRHGELVQVTRPKARHHRAQYRIRRLIEPLVDGTGVIDTEVPFRALPEYELRVADAAYMPLERWEQISLEDCLHSAPDLVIEVLSRSNTASEIFDKETLCLENGCQQFWVVDLKRKRVRVTNAAGLVTTYQPGQVIPLFMAPGKSIPVDAIFEPEL